MARLDPWGIAGRFAAGCIIGIAIMAAHEGICMRNPYTGKVRPTARPLGQAPTTGPLSLAVGNDGERVTLEIAFRSDLDRKLSSKMTAAQARELAEMLHDAADAVDPPPFVELTTDGTYDDLLAESMARTQ